MSRLKPLLAGIGVNIGLSVLLAVNLPDNPHVQNAIHLVDGLFLALLAVKLILYRRKLARAKKDDDVA